MILCVMMVLSYGISMVALATTYEKEAPQPVVILPAAAPAPQPEPAPVPQPVEDEPQPEQPTLVSTDLIDQVSEEYDLVDGKYWSTATMGNSMGNVSDNLIGSNSPVDGYYMSYNYQNQYECHGFACYLAALAVTKLRGEHTEAVPRNGNVNGFIKLLPGEVTYLQIGDIVRVEGDGVEHTALVYDIEEDGRLYFIESGGGNACRIRMGEGFNHTPALNTLEAICNRYPLEYVYRYVGETEEEMGQEEGTQEEPIQE